MDFTWAIKYATEFLGTAILIILGNGAVANVELKGTKGHQSGWIVIAVGYGMGVMIPALMFGNVSGNHINPAFTLGLAISGLFPWAQVAPYIIAQVLGAIFGQALVVATHRPYYLKTENPNNILGTFSTISSLDNGTKESHFAATVNGFVNEFVGSFVLFFAALGMTKNFFGSEVLQYMKQMASQAGQNVDFSDLAIKAQVAPHTASGLSVAHLALGFLVMALVTSLGGPTGPALNPARDLGPRLLHAFLPKSVLGEHKGDSKWWYSWVPVVAPIAAAIAAVAIFKFLYL
ncbi:MULTISPECIES: aquaglyceroporin Gla [Streptococcus]|jgi:glycerol facilitator-aquaporin|uniref:Aquaporin n=4 Tax=Streptococcus TaxID=1301 RepID=A0A150NT78_STRMT|nr:MULTISPECIES: aquaglyceroporin Gla [Streptococcus]HEW2289908.1 aquaporin family protein [Streptococcus pneumoniae]KXT94703.1 Glycerol uptake facilitator protein [Streptococcus mitis]KYF32201.1 Glycerol uptake facilitator protein [Streptococcus mitis]KYF36674.1 Glycerol uptake facilitator protein [Streptococcus mitis]MBW7579318.1 aquaporin family protein [Streptococcus humanilactis]